MDFSATRFSHRGWGCVNCSCKQKSFCQSYATNYCAVDLKYYLEYGLLLAPGWSSGIFLFRLSVSASFLFGEYRGLFVWGEMAEM
jgi:hypothetical protein